MVNTYDFKKHNTFKVSKRSKLYNLVIFCNTLSVSHMRYHELTQDERDYLNYYEYFKNLDSQGLFYFYSLRDKLRDYLLKSDNLLKKLCEFFYNPKACNIDVDTLVYCSILLNNFGYDFTDFLDKWDSALFVNGELFFK